MYQSYNTQYRGDKSCSNQQKLVVYLHTYHYISVASTTS